MLQRSIGRSLRSLTPTGACTSCVCRCGRRIGSDGPSTSQRRYKPGGLATASPAVRRKKRHEQRVRPLSPAEQEELRWETQQQQTWHLHDIERAARLNFISIDVSTAVTFLRAFTDLCDALQHSRPDTSPVDVARLQSLTKELHVSESDCNWLAHHLLTSHGSHDRTYGKKLLFSLSHLGSETATIRVVAHALAKSKHEPGTLKTREIQHMRRHLKQIADAGDNYRAMVLQGKVDYALGNHGAAIKLWTDAMDEAVAHGEDMAARWARGERGPEDDKNQTPGADQQELSSPWVELSSIHIAHREWAKAKWAIGIGCKMDDPMAHYYAAMFERQTNAAGEHEPTSAWLYHATKAAASGHPQAAHELGFFYGRSGWKYIEDEPPDHLKPTAFDSYPPETAKQRTGLIDTLKTALGLKSGATEDPQENVFRTAHYPADPVGRMRLALEWLAIAAGRFYAPAHLAMAEFHLEETLWSKAATPPEAFRLDTDERYDYASKADKDANMPIERLPKEESDDSEEIPNPFYDPVRARHHIRQVLHADAAQRFHMEVKEQIRLGTRRGLGVEAGAEEYIFTELGLAEWRGVSQRGLKPQAAAFYRFPEFREMYMDDARGVSLDQTRTPAVDIAEAAKAICEVQGWTMYDEDGVLMYRHGMRPTEAATRAGRR